MNFLFSGILKNAPKPELPVGFFDSPSTTNGVKNDIKIKNPLERLMSYNDDESVDDNDDDKIQVDNDDKPEDENDNDESNIKLNSDIPEGFFDDPVLDAKVSLYFKNYNIII